MKYYEITIETTSEASELVAEILTDAGSNGISIFDPNDLLELSDSGVIWDYMDEHLIQNDGKAQVKGYFAPSDLESSLEYIKSSFETLKQNCPFEYGSLGGELEAILSSYRGRESDCRTPVDRISGERGRVRRQDRPGYGVWHRRA